MNESLNRLLEILLSGDRNQISFHIRNNFEDYKNDFPFLHDRIDVGTAIERILKESKNEDTINSAIDKIGTLEEQKYKRRNYILILADLYLENNDQLGLETIISEKLSDEFKFHGYRKLLLFYSKNYDEKKFLDVFKKIEKRNSLTPIDRNGIREFIEEYSSRSKNIEQVKELVRKRKIFPKIGQFIVPMIIGYFGNRKDFQFIETLVRNELESDYEIFFTCENIYNELYKRSSCETYKLQILDVLEDLCKRIPTEIRVKGYPSKLWTLLLWRVGCKYLELNKKEKVEQIIKTLNGKNKSSLKELYNTKWN